MNKTALIERIKTLDGLTNDEKSALLGLLRSHKKYGLVWEEKPENIEEYLRDELPILNEVSERAIVSADSSSPNHMIIEGDNLEVLTVLSYTHENKIDIIYIDPPYNTGNKDFVYNDSFVDKEDSYRHSKWLSFMNKRLKLAKRLLANDGVIFISIDDNEQANLKILCDEILGSENFVGCLPTIMNLKGNQDEYGFAGTHEYTLVYVKNKENCTLGQLSVDDEELDSWLEDNVGYYKKGATLKRTGVDAPRSRRPYGYFPILVDSQKGSVECITEDEYKRIFNPLTKEFDDFAVSEISKKYTNLGYTVLLPYIEEEKTSWRWGYNKVCNNKEEIIVTSSKEGYSLYKKQRPEFGNLPSKKPKSTLYKPQYSSGNGTAQLKEMKLDGKFNNPKPIELIMDLIYIGNKKNATVLDFFAGSGTTLHAVMKLNTVDGGNRRCILTTNNENNICEEVTYIRNKKAIEGYITPKGIHIEGLSCNNLRYYRSTRIDREQTMPNMRRLVSLATDMLCIKEDIYFEVKTFGKLKLNEQIARYFNNGSSHMLIIYREEAIRYFVDEIEKMNFNGILKVYLFAPDRYAFDDDFFAVNDKVQLCALPAAIYDAYQKVLPKRKPKFIEVEEVESAENTNSDSEEGEGTLF